MLMAIKAWLIKYIEKALRSAFESVTLDIARWRCWISSY